jgi:hypothetical protein
MRTADIMGWSEQGHPYFFDEKGVAICDNIGETTHYRTA